MENHRLLFPSIGQNAPTQRIRLIAHSEAEAGALPASLVFPMASSRFCSESKSSERIGKLTKMLMRFESIRNVSAKASRISASFPVAAAGSGTPQ